MILTYRPIQVWPEGWDPDNPPTKSSLFDSTFQQTLELLDTELYLIKATNPTLQVDAPEARVRMDGQLHAQAVVNYPGVILSFQTPDYGTLTYACNRFGSGRWRARGSAPGWHENLRAIAKGLEALRLIERYGIGDRGEQYAGYAALGSGIPMGAGTETKPMTVEEAAKILAGAADTRRWADLLEDRLFIGYCYKLGIKNHHPDNGGDPAKFDLITKAKDFLLENVA